MTERPHLHKSKMASLVAKTFRKFSYVIVVIMYKLFIVYFLGGGGAPIFFVSVIKSQCLFF